MAPQAAAERIRPPLQLILVWHPRLAPEDSSAISSWLYSRLNRDESNPHYRGAGIPVYFRTSVAAPIDFDSAYTTVLLPIVSKSLVADPAWNDAGLLGRLAQQVADSRGRHHMVPIALTANVTNLDLAGNPQPIRLENLQGDQRLGELEERLLEYLCRLLRSTLKRKGPLASAVAADGQPVPVQLFLSHAKKGGGDALIQRIRNALDKTPLKTFYDARDITRGADWQKALQDNAGSDILLALLTDPYPTRDWCRREILAAKEAGCPIVAVVALDQGEARSFPYGGNIPTIPWRTEATPEQEVETVHRILRVSMRELLRHTHFLRQCETMQEQGHLPKWCVGLGSPPELLTFHFLERARGADDGPCLALYPDPPLSLKERELFAGLRSNIKVATPMTAGGGAEAEANLKDKEIALSLGSVKTEEMLQAGLSLQHLVDAANEISRHLLARGATLAYGGAPTATFTEGLVDLVEAHLQEGELRFNRLRNYVAEPYMPADPDDYLSNRIKTVDLRPVPAPADVRGMRFDPGPEADELGAAYVRARHLTEMRRVMAANKEIVARVALGGKIEGFSGRYPGIAEEVLSFLESGKPVFVLGGFCGCASAVAALLDGREDNRLSDAYLGKDAKYAAFHLYYNQRVASTPLQQDLAIDYDRMQKVFRQAGAGGLRNGLTAGENAVLFETQDLTEIIYYLLKGLRNLPGA
jgi:SLOG cluster2/TIR domain